MYGNYPMQQQQPQPQPQQQNGFQANGMPATYPLLPSLQPYAPLGQVSQFARNMTNTQLPYIPGPQPVQQYLHRPTAPVRLIQHAPQFHPYDRVAQNLLQPNFLPQLPVNPSSCHQQINFHPMNTANINSQQFYDITSSARPLLNSVHPVGLPQNQNIFTPPTGAAHTIAQNATKITTTSISQMPIQTTRTTEVVKIQHPSIPKSDQIHQTLQIEPISENTASGAPRLSEKVAETTKKDDDDIIFVEEISTTTIKKKPTVVDDDDVIIISRPATPTVGETSKKQPSSKSTVTENKLDGQGIPNNMDSLREKDLPNDVDEMFNLLIGLGERGEIDERSEDEGEMNLEEEEKDKVGNEVDIRDQVVAEAEKRVESGEKSLLKRKPERKNRKPKESGGRRRKRQLVVNEVPSTSNGAVDVNSEKKARIDQLREEELKLMLEDFTCISDENEEFED